MIVRFISYAIGGFISAQFITTPEVAGAIFIGMVFGDISASISWWFKGAVL